MVGPHAKHRRNSPNGWHLLDLLSNTRMTAASTLFQHRMAHRSTWFPNGPKHPDGRPVRNQIDHILVRQRYSTSVLDCRSYGGFSTASDHHPLIMAVRWRCRALRPPPPSQHLAFRRYNQFSQDQAAEFEAKVSMALPSIPPPPTTDTASTVGDIKGGTAEGCGRGMADGPPGDAAEGSTGGEVGDTQGGTAESCRRGVAGGPPGGAAEGPRRGMVGDAREGEAEGCGRGATGGSPGDAAMGPRRGEAGDAQGGAAEACGEGMAGGGTPGDPTQLLTAFTEALHEAAASTVGMVRRGSGQCSTSYSTEEITSLSQRQKALRIQMDATRDPHVREQLQQQRRATLKQLHRALRAERERIWQERVAAIDLVRDDSRRFFAAIRELRSIQAGRKNYAATHVEDPDTGQMVADLQTTISHFTSFFNQLFHDPTKRDAFHGRGGVMAADVTEEEVGKVLGRMKLGRAPGHDGITVEMLRAGGRPVVNFLTKFFNLIIRSEMVPRDFNLGLLIPLLKPGKKARKENFRPVMLLSAMRKLLAAIILDRAKPALYGEIRERQAGFRSGRSTADGVFFMRMMCERACLGDWTYAAALLDFSRAFDTISREVLLQRLHDFRIPTNIIALLLSNTIVRVKLSGQLGEEWTSNMGVVQGCGLSPLLFAGYLECTMRQLDGDGDPVREEGQVPVQDTLYADDVALHRRTIVQAGTMADAAQPVFGRDGLDENLGKRQLVEARGVPVKDQQGWRIVKHLGSLLGTAEDVAHRIRRAEAAFSQVQWHRHSMETRILLFRSLVMSVLTYNAGLWTLTDGLERKLDGWQRRKMRFAGGYSWPHVVCNRKLYRQFRVQPVSEICRRMRLRWFGHVIREGEESASYMAYQMARDISGIRRRVGRPQLRWVDKVEIDVRKVGLTLARAEWHAADKRAWTRIVDQCLRAWS